ncbi:MAG TPA: GNAT family N-acetyltransferase [Gemmatimonadales bacterium]|nr:GNAT family N-acetyltransferase [Gemmatimonadales bacterium]
MTAGITVRLGTAADAELLYAMGHRTFLHTFGPPNDPADLAAYMTATYSPAPQAAELADPTVTFLIAMQGEIPVGYAKLRSGRSGDGIRAANPLELQRFYADVPLIGQGVGGILMAAIIAHAERVGHDAIWLAVWEHNPRARRFYERHGFRAVGRQDFLLGRDLQHDLVMERS